MINEDYVSYKIAKLLEEKGFDEKISMVYTSCGELCKCTRYDSIRNSNYNDITKNYFECTAPTLQMAMKWLREVHHLVIQIEFIDFLEHGEVWLYSIIERKTIKQLTSRGEDFTEHSYEEACEAAIEYCLENLI